MQQLFRKIRRVEPMIRLRQQKVDLEASVLAQIRSEKLTLVASLKDSQRQYIDGVTQLNQLRQTPGRERLEAMEMALDTVKSRWASLVVKVQEAERKERAQVAVVLNAEQDLRAVEKLKERYQTAIGKADKVQEQKRLDEYVLRTFGRNTP